MEIAGPSVRIQSIKGDMIRILTLLAKVVAKTSLEASLARQTQLLARTTLRMAEGTAPSSISTGASRGAGSIPRVGSPTIMLSAQVGKTVGQLGHFTALIIAMP